VAGVEPFDTSIMELMRRRNIAGITLAIARDGRLILARGYGYADFENRELMQPDTRLRIASLSKTITAVAALRLYDAGLLDLDRKALDILTQYSVPADGDQRLRDITVRHLLQHTAGWDRNLAGDPPFQGASIAQQLSIPGPAACSDIIRYTLARPLQYAPGTRFVYSNVGFCMLGEIVRVVSGMPYETYVRNSMLAPIDIRGMAFGYTQRDRRGPNEAKYYTYDGAPLVQSVFPGEGLVEPPYGAYELLALEGAGAWVASAVDVARFMTAVEGTRVGQFLSANALAAMSADPQVPGIADPAFHYGMGVLVGPAAENWSQEGTLAGTQAQLVRNRVGSVWVIIANTRPQDTATLRREFIAAVTAGFEAHLPGAFPGSSSDLFLEFPSQDVPPRTQ
jgi:CubicO group peptidase (beta-lactamase class C family)